MLRYFLWRKHKYEHFQNNYIKNISFELYRAGIYYQLYNNTYQYF